MTGKEEGRSRAAVNSLAAATMLLIAGLLPARAEEKLQRFVFEKAEMGVPFRITMYADDPAKAKAAADAAFERVEVMNNSLSDYDSDSEISRLSRTSGQGKAVPVTGVLWRVLEKSQQIAERTDGAFDVTVGPLVNLWRRCRRKQELPSPDLLAEMRARVGYKNLRLDPQSHTAELLKPDMRLDVGGIAKGYAADEAIAVLAQRGITRALAAASGDIVAGDPPPGEAGWRVEVATLDVPGAPPPQILMLAHRGVSTSGDAYQYVEIDGVRYSHIVNPRTGVGMTDHSLVTVVAPNGLTADGMDTAIDVLGPERGLKYVEDTPDTAVRILRRPGQTVEEYESSRWKSLPRPSQ